MALQAYRSLLRASRLTFAGDERLLNNARQSIRAGFREKAGLAPSDPAVAPAVQQAEQIAEMLRTNVVQGRDEGDGRFSKSWSPVDGRMTPGETLYNADRLGVIQSYGFMSIPSGATMIRSRRRVGRLSRLGLGAAQVETSVAI